MMYIRVTNNNRHKKKNDDSDDPAWEYPTIPTLIDIIPQRVIDAMISGRRYEIEFSGFTWNEGHVQPKRMGGRVNKARKKLYVQNGTNPLYCGPKTTADNCFWLALDDNTVKVRLMKPEAKGKRGLLADSLIEQIIYDSAQPH